MIRFPPLSLAEIKERISVDLETGRCVWVDATKYHSRLNGLEAGSARGSRSGKSYWIIKINGVPYKRAQIVLMVKTHRWPDDMVDHEDGNSLNDKASNLRHATGLQNAWNHKSRAKKSPLPMGVRQTRPGKYQARIAVKNKQMSLGVFGTIGEAVLAYQAARKEYFNDFA